MGKQLVKLLGPVKLDGTIHKTEVEADDVLLAELRSLGLVDDVDPLVSTDHVVVAPNEIMDNVRAELERQIDELRKALDEQLSLARDQDRKIAELTTSRDEAVAAAEGLLRELETLKATAAKAADQAQEAPPEGEAAAKTKASKA